MITKHRKRKYLFIIESLTLFLKRTDPDYEISDPRVPVCMTNVGLGVVDVV